MNWLRNKLKNWLVGVDMQVARDQILDLEVALAHLTAATEKLQSDIEVLFRAHEELNNEADRG